MFCLKKEKVKKGQVTLFIIVGVILFAGIVLFFIFNDNIIGVSSIDKEFQSVYDYYLSCIKSVTKEGVVILGDNAGYIEKPNLVSSTKYTPFSSELNHLGMEIPYWLYLAPNGSFIEQVPQLSDMESQLEKYIGEKIIYCNFSEYVNSGYVINVDKSEVAVTIDKERIIVNVVGDLDMHYNEKSSVVSMHTVSVDSKLGKYYDLAKQIFVYEKENVFLENYTMDVLWNYAPVDSINFDCDSTTFKDEDIRSNITEALNANINLIKFSGNNYDSSNVIKKYFTQNIGVNFDENVNIVYNPNWTSRIDFYGDRNVNPIGNVANMLGMCFSNVHFVYDIQYPVLIQIWDEDFVFQYPVGVVIDNNNPREALSSAIKEEEPIGIDMCNYRDSKISVKTYDSYLNPIKADLSFKCIDDICNLGETDFIEGEYIYSGKIPTCINGVLTVSSDGYSKYNKIIATDVKSYDIILYKEHELEIYVNDLANEDKVMLNFYGSNGNVISAMYPETSVVKLSEDEYDIVAYIYSGSEITIPASTEKYCTSSSNIFSELFGLENCQEVTTPSTTVENVVIGGGKVNQYFTDEMLQNSNILYIDPVIFDTPNDVESFQNNYLNVETSILGVELG